MNPQIKEMMLGEFWLKLDYAEWNFLSLDAQLQHRPRRDKGPLAILLVVEQHFERLIADRIRAWALGLLWKTRLNRGIYNSIPKVVLHQRVFLPGVVQSKNKNFTGPRDDEFASWEPKKQVRKEYRREVDKAKKTETQRNKATKL